MAARKILEGEKSPDNVARKIAVTNYSAVELRPRVNDPDIAALLPFALIPMRVSLELHGVNVAVANAVRRAIMTEVPVRHLDVILEAPLDYVNAIKYTEEFLIPDDLHKRLQQIPLRQDTPVGTKYTLHCANTAFERQTEVHSINIRPIAEKPNGAIMNIARDRDAAKKLPFNHTHTVCALRPGRMVRIPEIIVVESAPWQNVGPAMGVRAICTVLDVEPYNPFEQRGTHAAMSRPMEHLLRFETNGTIAPIDLLLLAIKGIKDRLRAVHDLTTQLQSAGDMHVLTLRGETDTIGNLLFRSVYELNPGIEGVTYDCNLVNRSVMLKVRYVGAPEMVQKIIIDAAKHAEKTMTQLGEAIAALR